MEEKDIRARLNMAKGLQDSVLAFSDHRDQEHLNQVFAAMEELVSKAGGLLLAADPAGEKEGQQQITLRFLKSEDGKNYAAVFTDEEEKRGDGEEQNGNALLLPAGEILNIVANHPTADGLVINPFSNSFIMLKEAVQALQNKMRTANVEEKLKGSHGITQAITLYYEEQKKYEESEMPEEERRAGIEKVLQGFLQGMERNAQLLVAIVPPDKKEGETMDGQVLFNHLSTSDGRDAMAVFTSGEEVRKNKEATAAIAMPILEVLRAAVHISEQGKLDGMIINPWSQSFFLSLHLIKWLLDAGDRRDKLSKENEEKRSLTKELSENMIYSSLIGGSLGLAKERGLIEKAPFKKEAFSLRPSINSILLSEFNSLNTEKRLSMQDIMEKMYDWKSKGVYLLDGKMEDSVDAIEAAIMRYATGKKPEELGSDMSDDSVLCRILPFSLLLCRRLHQFSDLDRAMLHDGTRLTHNHPVALLMAELYSYILRNLVLHIGGESLEEQLSAAASYVGLFYEDEEAEDEEEARMNEEAKLQHREDVRDYDRVAAEYARLLPFMNVEEIKNKKEEELVLDGSAEKSLYAAVWTLLHTTSYQEAVEKAVELSGGKNLPILVSTLAAAHYGYASIPKEWKESLAGKEEAYELAREWQARWLD